MIIALIGLSGTGKTHMLHYLLESMRNKPMQLLAVTTRAPRAGETNGVDKHFLTEERFEKTKEQLICIHRMYGARYGFFRSEIATGEEPNKPHRIVELYFSDYIRLRRAGFSVIGIYVYTLDRRKRRDVLRQRYKNNWSFYQRVISDFFCSMALSIMDLSGRFDIKVLNEYDKASELRLLSALEEKLCTSLTSK